MQGEHPDPATALLEQVRHAPDGDALGGLLTEWHAVFGSAPTTVRKAVEAAHNGHPHLLDAMGEFPIEAHSIINRLKLGCLLKLNATRIVGGPEFQKAEADGRGALRVVGDKTPPLPLLPPFNPPVGKTVTARVAGYEHEQIKNNSEIDITDGWDEAIESLNPKTPAPPLKNS